MDSPRLLIISHVLPFPGKVGQQQRVFYKLRALRNCFHLTFLTIAESLKAEETKNKLLDYCDEAIVLPSAYSNHPISRAWHKTRAVAYSLRTGLKPSNYAIGNVELSPV